MSHDAVWDLGELGKGGVRDETKPRAAQPGVPHVPIKFRIPKPETARSESAAVASSTSPTAATPAAAPATVPAAKAVAPPVRRAGETVLRVETAGSLSLFLPGTGRLMQRDYASGLAYMAWFAFSAVFCVAILGTLSRITPTLAILEFPRGAGLWALGAIFVAAAGLHVASVVHSIDKQAATTPLPPWVVGVASFIVPGWGQVLNRDPLRAAVFLGGLWITAASWLLVSSTLLSLLDGQGLYMPEQVARICNPLVRWTLPAVIWALAIYDAAATAAARRRI